MHDPTSYSYSGTCTASLRILLHCMSSTPKDTRSKPQRINKSTIFTGLLLFLGLSWILSQTTAVHKFKPHFPNTAEEEMSNKRTVGYFVCPFTSFKSGY
jgi:hypothetical protein